MLSYREFLVRAVAQGFIARTRVTGKAVVYAPMRSSDRFPWVDDDIRRYTSKEVIVINPRTGKRHSG